MFYIPVYIGGKGLFRRYILAFWPISYQGVGLYLLHHSESVQGDPKLNEQKFLKNLNFNQDQDILTYHTMHFINIFSIQFNYQWVRHHYQDIIILFTRGGVWRPALKPKISSSHHFHLDQGVGTIIKTSSFKTPGCRGLPRHAFWTLNSP